MAGEAEGKQKVGEDIQLLEEDTKDMQDKVMGLELDKLQLAVDKKLKLVVEVQSIEGLDEEELYMVVLMLHML